MSKVKAVTGTSGSEDEFVALTPHSRQVGLKPPATTSNNHEICLNGNEQETRMRLNYDLILIGVDTSFHHNLHINCSNSKMDW